MPNSKAPDARKRSQNRRTEASNEHEDWGQQLLLEELTFSAANRRPTEVPRHNLESKERQYALEGRARQLGFSKVVVIDEDLVAPVPASRSGRASAGYWRPVCQGLAGAVFALEASRLARNNRDWHHLVDPAHLMETLLTDCDGIWLIRGNSMTVWSSVLKGTMSEFELGLLRQRAREAFEQKVRRGFAL